MRPEDIRGLFQNAADFEEHTVEACGKRLTAFFIDGLTSGGDIAELVLRPLRENLRADGRQTLLEQAEIMKERFVKDTSREPKFAVSCQHYSFAVNAFVDIVKEYDADQYSFILRETQTGEII